MDDRPTSNANPPPDDASPRSTTAPYVLYTSFPCAFGPRYQLVAELGRGGMGVVYKARDTRLKREVALKIPTVVDDRWREQFLREAQAAAGLNHPNICRILDCDELNGQPYLSMEFIEGVTLKKQLAAGTLAPRAAAELVRAIARGMGKAHECGIVHRDLKPGNVMLARDDARPVVFDFGLALQLASEVPRETVPGTILGTPSYMAPEQARGSRDAIGPPTDVWAMGVILYELLTGARPFVGTSVVDLLFRIVHQEPQSARAINPAVDPALEAIIVRSLQKNSADRYQNGAELAAALDDYLNAPPPLSLSQAELQPVPQSDSPSEPYLIETTTPAPSTAPRGAVEVAAVCGRRGAGVRCGCRFGGLPPLRP